MCQRSAEGGPECLSHPGLIRPVGPISPPRENRSTTAVVCPPVSDTPKPPQLVEGVDYYREGPYLVFTEAFLRRRGWCCESGCRHCPWDYRPDRRSDVPIEED